MVLLLYYIFIFQTEILDKMFYLDQLINYQVIKNSFF